MGINAVRYSQAEGSTGAPEYDGVEPAAKVERRVGVAPAGMPDVILDSGGTL